MIKNLILSKIQTLLNLLHYNGKMETNKITKKDFLKGRIEIPGPLRGDAYTVAGQALGSEEANQRSVYGITFRRAPNEAEDFKGFAKDGRMILYGVNDFVRTHLTKPITREDIDNAEEFMETAHAFGGALRFDRSVWDKVVDEHQGYLPIKIDAIPEGSTFYKNEVPVQVSSVGEGFGEIAALVEATMVGMVSNASTRATMERHLLERFKDYVKEDMPPDTPLEDRLFAAQLMLHDFGMRASSSSEESELLGKAHLLSFPGTDTFNAAYQAYKENGDTRVGSSILALAHRTVMGHNSEDDCFQNLHSIGDPIASYVADCYDFKRAVKEKLIPLALSESSKENGQIVVARPDSGDYLENILYLVNTASENGLYSTQPNGRKAMTNLRFIQGDSMDWDKMKTIMDALKEGGYSPVNCGIFGVGGWLRNTPTRDTLSVAYKLMARGEHLEPTVKLSNTRAKMSVPGPVQILRGQGEGNPSTIMHYETELNGGRNIVRTVYDGSIRGDDKFRDPLLESFSTIQQRVINGFDNSSLVQLVLSPEIIKIQDGVMNEQGRNGYQF